jgi:hypothetical protein
VAFNGTGGTSNFTAGTFTAPTRWSVHFHYQNAAAPGTAVIDDPFSLYNKGGTPGTFDVNFAWDHTTGAQKQAWSQKRSGGSVDIAQLTSTLSANTWYRIGGRYDGTNLSAWLNGVKEVDTASADPATADAVSIGGLSGGGGSTANANDDGHLAELAVWNVALTNAEMLSLGKGISPLLIRPDSILLYHTMLRDDKVFINTSASSANSGITVTAHPPTVYWPATITTVSLVAAALVQTTVTQSTFIKPTITGPQSVIGLGFQPKALALWTDGQTAAGTTDGVQFSLGITDGTRQAVRAVNSSDNVGTSECSQAESAQRVIWLVSATETTQSSASLVSFDEDGFTITWDVNDGTAAVIHYLAFGGDAVEAARVDQWTVSGSGQSVTSVGFAPAAVLTLVSAMINPVTEQISDFGSFAGLGFVTLATLANSTSVAMIRDNQNPSDTYKRQRTDKSLIVSEIGLSGGAPRLQGAVTAQRFDGFDVAYDTTQGDAYRLTYLALRGMRAKVFTVTQPAGTGTQTISGIGFQPRSILMQSVGAAASSSTGNGAQLMLGVATSSAQSVATVADNDNVTPTVNARSHATDKVIRLITPTATGSASTVVADAAFTAFTSDGFTLNWITTDGTAREIIGIAFGDAAPAEDPIADPTGGGTVGAGTDPAAGLNLCPVEVPLAWVEVTPAGSATTYRYSKVPINIDSAPKFARVESFGKIPRHLSNDVADFRGVSVESILLDHDRVLRGFEDTDSLIGARASYYISSEAAIRSAATPRRVFDGVITDTEPIDDLRFRIQCADYFTTLMEEWAAKHTFPQRVYTLEDFPNMGNAPDALVAGNPSMLGKPVPIGYGLLSDESLGPDAVGIVPATFVGTRVINAFLWDEYCVFGHAPSPGGVLSIFGDIDGVRRKFTEDMYGVDVIAPGHTTTWNLHTGSSLLYRDYNGNRYTTFFARGPRSYNARLGGIPFVVNIGGIEATGDGTGSMIDGLHRQILHLLINWVFGDYRAGAWLASPLVPGSLYSRINTASFEAVATLSALYVTGGFKGAFLLGADGETMTFQEILRLAAVSGAYDYGINKDGQYIASMIHPAATLNRAIRDVTDIPAGSFHARRRRDQLRNVVTYRYGKRYAKPITNTTPAEGARLPGTNPIQSSPDWAVDFQQLPAGDPPTSTSITKYGQRKIDLDLAMIQDPATADAVAGLKLATLEDGPVIAGFKERLCGTSTELGARDTVTHFEGVTATGYTARSMRCESHVLDLDEISNTDSDGDVEKEYRDLTNIDYSGLEV